MNLDKLKVSSRLALGFGAILAMLLIVVVLGVARMGQIDAGLDTLLANRVPKVEKLNDLAYRAMDNARIVRNLVLVTDPQQLASNKAGYDKNLAAIKDGFAYLEEHVRQEDDKPLLLALQDARRAYERYTDQVVALGMANQNAEATQVLYGPEYKSQAAYFEAIRKLEASQKAKMDATGAQARASYASTRNTLVGLGVAALLAGVGLTVLIARGLLRQLGGEPAEAAQLARAVAAGDLTHAVRLKAGDTASLMANLQQMQASLSRVVSDVRASVDSVTTASSQIAAGNRDLSSRTEQQASSLQETASSMEQLTGTVRHSADNAQQADQLAASARKAAARGGEVVGQVVGTMDDISASSRKIADIIGVIDGIAFQTNILALNAAVEAARAGEQGRGFAVVAGEVRTLAQRSAEAAKEIKSLIGASVDKVESGSRQVAEAGEAMNEIVAQVRRVSDLIGEIASSAAEQSRGIGQVNQAVTQMDQVTQQNAALVEESAAAADSLAGQARNLVEAVAVFKVANHA